MDRSLEQCERDVEVARSKLAADLAVLRSPATVSSFTESLKDTALETKAAVIEQAKEAVQSKVNGFVGDLKAKAAANPAAALTIGAGIAWHVLRHPPIATALIGAGLFSLWRSQGVSSDRDYLQQGRKRLKEQASEFGASAMDVASDVGVAIADKAGEIVYAAKDTVQDWSQTAAESAAQAGEVVKTRVEAVRDGARRAVLDIGDEVSSAGRAVKQTAGEAGTATADVLRNVAGNAGNAASRATAAVDDLAGDAYDAGRQLIVTTDTRDKVLLGVAGFAVAAALSLAYQKRLSEEVE
jgi:hypothetical protein